jgi:putative transposase
MTHFINNHKERFGVEPVCRVWQFAPSTYYAARQRPQSDRWLRDEALKVKIRHVHAEHFGAYGVRKLWHQLRRQGIPVARCTVERPADLVDRNFRAAGPKRLWIADLTYVRTWSGFAYVVFVIDVFSRHIVGWQVSNHSTAVSLLMHLNRHSGHGIQARG